jgi:hypothetical protein
LRNQRLAGISATIARNQRNEPMPFEIIDGTS